MTMLSRGAILAIVTLLAGEAWAQVPKAAARPTMAAKTIRVGPTREVRSIAMAASLAQDGDTIEVDAGEYRADVAVWTRDDLTLRAVGGRAHLIADGASAERKAIWVIRGGTVRVENFEFSGVRVPDRNGAGIRFEKGRLIVRNSIFRNSENGILAGNDRDSEIEIHNSEFGNNGYGDGQSHNLYVGTMRKLTVTGSYFHHAKSGQLLKSRAGESHIFYNRLTDEAGGQASYELEFPSGGIAYVVGNIIQQASTTENLHVVSYGVEGYQWPRNELYLSSNTLVDDRSSGGVFLRAKSGYTRIRAVNNLLVGRGELSRAGAGEYLGNHNADWEDFALAVRQDYRLRKGSKLLGKKVAAGSANGVDLEPKSEYRRPLQVQPLKGPALHPGALQSLEP